MKKKRLESENDHLNNESNPSAKKLCTGQEEQSNSLIEMSDSSPAKFKLKFRCSQSLNISPKKTDVKKYFLNSESDIDQLERLLSEKTDFEYDRESNKNITNVKLYLAPVSVMGVERLGVFAGEDIKANTKIPIGRYTGERFQTGKEDERSLYIFQLSDEEGEAIEFIDAAKKGDWTREINSSQIVNVRAGSMEEDGKQKEILFYVAKKIKKDQQLLFDYGIHYRFDTNPPLYLHPDDNFRTENEIYNENRQFYAQGQYSFDEKTIKDLKLNSDRWVIPKLFQYVYEDDALTIEKLLADGCPPDLFAYACNEQALLDAKHQEHLTPFLLSCYLGNEKCIAVLIKYHADLDRCMLNAGFNALTLLAIGYASDEVFVKWAKKLLPKMDFPFTVDSLGLNFLHYIITRNRPNLVPITIETANTLRDDLYAPIYTRKKDKPLFADFSHCVQQGKFEILKVLLEKTLQKSYLRKIFIENINRIFKKETLNESSLEHLLRLKDLLDSENFEAIKETSLVSCLREVIQTKVFALQQSGEINNTEQSQIATLVKRKEYDIYFGRLMPEGLGPEDLFYTSIKYMAGINAECRASPLKFALYFSLKDVENILSQMENILKAVDKLTAFKMISELDGYQCISKALKMKNEDIYKRILAFYFFADINKQCILKLLIQAIHSYNCIAGEETILKKLFQDCSYNKHEFTLLQKEELFLQVIERFQYLQEKSNYPMSKIMRIIKVLMQCLIKDYSLNGAKYNKPLIIGLQKNLSVEFLRLFLNEGDILGHDSKGIAPLIVAIQNGQMNQVRMLLLHSDDLQQQVNEYLKDEIEIACEDDPFQFSKALSALSDTQKKLLQSAFSKAIPEKVSITKQKYSFTANFNKRNLEEQQNNVENEIVYISV